MFDEQTTPPEEQFKPEPPALEKNQGPSESKEIYTMPDKFIDKDSKKGGGRVSKLLIIILVIVIFAGVAFGAVILFNRLSEPEENANTVANANITNQNENANLNANLNANVNANQNANANGNANLNLNENLNTNANANTNVNANTNINLVPFPTTSDSDLDGLTDVEEDLYGTKDDNPDTDGDGYIDGKKKEATGDYSGEIYLGYDPTAANKRLDASNLVTRYTNTTYNWSMLYPKKWTATPLSSATGDKDIMFSPDVSTVEYILVSVQDNPSRLSAKSWYLSFNPSFDTSQLESLVVNGLDGVISPDATTVYLSKQDKIYVISYSVGSLTAVNYQTTFEMMYQSFKLTASSASASQDDAQRKSDLAQYRTALTLYYDDNRSYVAPDKADTAENLTLNIDDALVDAYISTALSDPGDNTYYYLANKVSAPDKYLLYVQLEAEDGYYYLNSAGKSGVLTSVPTSANY